MAHDHRPAEDVLVDPVRISGLKLENALICAFRENWQQSPAPQTLGELSASLKHNGTTPEFAPTLQRLANIFFQASDIADEGPNGMNLLQWRRILRELGEKLRASALTLAAGHGKIALAQLDVALELMGEHGDLIGLCTLPQKLLELA